MLHLDEYLIGRPRPSWTRHLLGLFRMAISCNTWESCRQLAWSRVLLDKITTRSLFATEAIHLGTTPNVENKSIAGPGRRWLSSRSSIASSSQRSSSPLSLNRKAPGISHEAKPWRRTFQPSSLSKDPFFNRCDQGSGLYFAPSCRSHTRHETIPDREWSTPTMRQV